MRTATLVTTDCRIPPAATTIHPSAFMTDFVGVLGPLKSSGTKIGGGSSAYDRKISMPWASSCPTAEWCCPGLQR